MVSDTYKTVMDISEAIYSDKRSKFLAFLIPVNTQEEVKECLAAYRKMYYDARHVCYAYMLGPERTDFRANDDGEPSGTAGRPILGMINSAGITNVLLVVVRYFGGIKLGTSGLITAYKEAAKEAVANAEIVTRLVEEDVVIGFDYVCMNQVMKIVKDNQLTIITQYFNNDCEMTLRIRKSEVERLRLILSKVDTLRILNK